MKQLARLTASLLVLLCWGCGRGCQPDPTGGQEKPQAVFQRASEALRTGDHATLYRCYQPGAEPLLLLETYLRVVDDPTRQDALKLLLAKHGVTASHKDDPILRDAMFAAVADKPACFAALMRLAPRLAPRTLIDVRTQGARAVGKAQSGKTTVEVLFRKIAGAWYLLPTLRAVSETEKSQHRATGAIAQMAGQGDKGRAQLAKLLAHETNPAMLTLICRTLLELGNPGLKLLLDDNPAYTPQTRQQIYQALLRLPASRGEAIPLLIDALAGQNPAPSVLLGSTFKEAATRPLIRALEHEHPTVRQQAATLLGASRDDVALAPLTAALKDAAVRQAAALALSAYGPRAEGAIAGLIDVLRHPDASQSAATALGRIGKPAVAALTIALRTPALARAAASALAHIGPDAVAATAQLILTVQLKYGAYEEAAQALGAIGPGAAAAVPTLIAALAPRASARLHLRAQNALVEIGKPALPELARATRHANPEIRRAAISVLGRIGLSDPVISRALMESLKDPSARVRWQAVGTLRALKDTRALAALEQKARDDKAPRVRNAALVAVWALDPKRALPHARSATHSAVAECRRQAADVLGRLGPSAAEAYDELLKLLGDTHWSVRRASATALGQLGDARAIAALKKLAQDPIGLVREAAAGALKKLKR